VSANVPNQICQDWYQEDYKILSEKNKALTESDLHYSGRIIWRVDAGSPAEFLGLQKGDYLYRINGKATFWGHLNRFRQFPKRFGRHKFQFYRPTTQTLTTVQGRLWPFGIQTREATLEIGRRVRIGDGDLEPIEVLWKEGDHTALAAIYMDVETLNYRALHLDFASFEQAPLKLPHENTPLSREIWHSHFSALALCAACAGHFKRAHYVLDEIAIRHAEGDSGFPCLASSMMSYTESLLAEAGGHKELAIEHIYTAIDQAWEVEQNYQRLSELTGHDVNPQKLPFLSLGKITDYTLPIFDPLTPSQHPVGQKSLMESLSQLSDSQCIFVVIMAGYRSNYFYNEGWDVAAPILAKLKHVFPEIHILTAGTYMLDDSFAKAEEPLKDKSIPYLILFDENAQTASRLNVERCPTNLAINNKGEIIAEGAFYDESVIWTAVEALNKSNSN
jgi:hypothetical protein